MSEYLAVYFGISTAGPKAVVWDNAMIVGAKGSSTLTESKVYVLTPDDYETQLTDDGFALTDQFYESVAIFFAASPSPQLLYAYAHVSGASQDYIDVPLEFVQGNIWELPIKPPSGFYDGEKVKFFLCGENIGTGYTENFANGATGIGFTIEKDGANNWTGRLEFTNGLSGSAGIVKPLTSDCKVTASFSAGTQTGVGTAISDYNIKMISLALQNSDSIQQYASNIFGSQVDDMMTMLNAIAGKNCQFFYALPGNAQPETTITGASNKWKELKSLMGAREDVSVIKVIPSSLNHDAATGYMALTAVSHPHKQMSFAEPHFGIKEREPAINKGKWRDGQIACIMKITELQGDPYLVTYGFTFGSGDAGRIEGVRCRYIISQTLINNLWGLLAQRETLVSYDGCQEIKAVIRGTFKTLKDQRIVEGLNKIYIPIEEDLRKNTAAGRLARQKYEIPAVEIEYIWEPGVERIIITRAENIAT